MPDAYADAKDEARRVREAVGLQDVSTLGKVDVRGPGIDRALGSLNGRSDVAVLRLRPDRALAVTPTGQAAAVSRLMTCVPDPGQPGERAPVVTDLTSAYAALRVAGPRATDLLARVTGIDLRDSAIPDRKAAQTSLARVAVTLQRQDWGSLRTYLLLFNRDVGEYAWDALLEAGAGLGLTPFGHAAAQTLGRGA